MIMDGQRLRKRHREPRVFSKLKGVLREIIIGVVVGIIVLVFTPILNHAIATKEAQNELSNNLSSVSIGMSKSYIDDLFGKPIIESVHEGTEGWPWNFQIEETLTAAGYKLKDSVLLCLYCSNDLAAFVVVVNEEHLYHIPINIFYDDCYLLDFTYADFSETIDIAEGNVPGNNDDYAYYSELYYGGGAADYNYFIIGSYKDYRNRTEAENLMIVGERYLLSRDMDSYKEQYDEDLHYKLRQQVHPNVFGIVSPDFAANFNFVMQIVGNRVNGGLLFNDWWHKYVK